MHYLKFLQQLFDTGRVAIESSDLRSESAVAESESLLAEFELQWRNQLPGGVPRFDLAAASWAGQNFYRACQLLMNRNLNQQERQSGFPEPNFDLNKPDSHYSVDVVFRFLPDLWNFAKAIERTEPLSQRIADWCLQWPLSSVGTANLDTLSAVDVSAFANDRCLNQLYADRIIRHVDMTRVNDPQVLATIESSIGEHSELARRFQTELSKKTPLTEKSQ